MRLFYVAFLSLISTAALASNISLHKVRNYSIKELSLCEQDLAAVTTRIESETGFKVIEGACAAINASTIQMSLSYSHPITRTIQHFEKKLDSSAECFALSNNAQSDLEAGHLVYLYAYCNGNTLVADFLSLKGYNIRKILDALYFDSKNACEKHIKNISTNYAGIDAPIILASCNKSGVHYMPDAQMASHFTKDFGFLRGKILANNESCFENIQVLNDNFQKLGLTLVYNFCAISFPGAGVQEHIYYVGDSNGAKIRTFEGSIRNTQEDCAIGLQSASEVLLSLGKNELYKYCKATNAKTFIPTIYHAEKL